MPLKESEAKSVCSTTVWWGISSTGFSAYFQSVFSSWMAVDAFWCDDDVDTVDKCIVCGLHWTGLQASNCGGCWRPSVSGLHPHPPHPLNKGEFCDARFTIFVSVKLWQLYQQLLTTSLKMKYWTLENIVGHPPPTLTHMWARFELWLVWEIRYSLSMLCMLHSLMFLWRETVECTVRNISAMTSFHVGVH